MVIPRQLGVLVKFGAVAPTSDGVEAEVNAENRAAHVNDWMASAAEAVPTVSPYISSVSPPAVAKSCGIAIGGIAAGAVAGRIALRGWLYLGRLALYLIFILLIRQNKHIRYTPKVGFTVVGLLIAVWGLLQYVFMPDTRWLSVFGWDNHYYRLIGTMFDPAFTGMLLVIGFGLWQWPALSARIKQLVQLIIAIAIAATFSRASYIALLVLSSLQVMTGKLKLSFFMILWLVFAVSLFFLPKPGGEGVNLARLSTGEARLMNAQQNLVKLDGLEWVWGRGLFNSDATQTYQTPSHAQLPDSLPILLLNSLGLGGLLLTALVFIKWFKRWWQVKPAWTSLLIAVLVHSLFNNTFLQPFVFLALWLIF